MAYKSGRVHGVNVANIDMRKISSGEVEISFQGVSDDEAGREVEIVELVGEVLGLGFVYVEILDDYQAVLAQARRECPADTQRKARANS